MVREILPEQGAGLIVVGDCPHITLTGQQFRFAIAVNVEELHRIHVVVVLLEVLRVVPDFVAVRIQAEMADDDFVDAVAIHVVWVDVVSEVIFLARLAVLPELWRSLSYAVRLMRPPVSLNTSSVSGPSDSR